MRQGGLIESGSKILAEDEVRLLRAALSSRTRLLLSHSEAVCLTHCLSFYSHVSLTLYQLSRSDMSTLFLSFDKGRNALQSIFNSYLESPVYKPTGSKLDRTSRLLRMTSCPCKVGEEHAFVDSPSERVKLDPAAPLSTAQYGVSLRGVAQFAMDFDLHPTILSPSLLFRIFEEVLSSTGLHTTGSDLDLSGISPVRTKGSGTDDTLWKLRVRGVQSPSTGKSVAATSASKHGEPLLSLDQVRAMSHILFTIHYYIHSNCEHFPCISSKRLS
jgi:hypothetical protein